ncbi:MAG: amylo-alpha-1,6-glucosidase [Candidatus Diapherotrites archaeon]
MVSPINKNSELGKYSYFLSNKDCFFHRYYDTGFKTKWTGFWSNGKKYIEFFDFKVFGKYLSESNCIKATYDFTKATHVHAIDDGVFIQSVWTPLSGAKLVVELQSANNKNFEAEFEFAINIRKREENWHDRDYVVKQDENENCINVSSSLGQINICVSGSESQFVPLHQYFDHYPSGEKQRYFLPGILKLKGTTVRILFSLENESGFGDNELLSKRSFYRQLTNCIECDDPLISGLYKKAILNMELLFCGNCYYAGLPWFLQFWARDMFWSLPAFLYAGFLNRAKSALEVFSDKVINGRVPNYIYGDEVNYSSIDSSIMFISALRDYIAFSGDTDFLENKIDLVCDIMQRLLAVTDSRGFISHDSKENETWMDSLNRYETAIEIQALFVKALSDFSELVFLAKKPSGAAMALAFEAEGLARRQQHLFEKVFYNDGKYADRICGEQKDFSKRPNALVPIMLGLSKFGIEEFEKSDILCEKGVMSLSSENNGFDSASYHNGQAWSLCTGWLACAEFAMNRVEKGYEILKIIDDYTYGDTPGCIGESWNSKTFERMGCNIQLWGAALAIRAIDEFMLGIKPYAPRQEIEVCPRLPSSVGYVKRTINLGGKETSIIVKKQGTSVKVGLSR